MTFPQNMSSFDSLIKQKSFSLFENLPNLAISSTPQTPIQRYHDSHGWQKSKGNKKGNLALSALTLLAFLFFLHILQSCIQDHMHEMKYDKGGHYYKPTGMMGTGNGGNGINRPIVIVDDTNSRQSSAVGRDKENTRKGETESGGEIDEDDEKWPVIEHKHQEEKSSKGRKTKQRRKKTTSKNHKKEEEKNSLN